MKYLTPILFLLIVLTLTAAAVFYLSKRFAFFFPVLTMKSWVWIFAAGLVFSLIGSIGFPVLSNPFVKVWSAAVTDLLQLAFRLAPPLRGIITLGLTLVITAYGVWNAFHIRVKEVTIPISGLTKEIRAVHLTDIHLGNSWGKKQLEEIVRITKELNPEIIFHTGDLFDSKTHFNGNEDVLDAFQTIARWHG